MSFPDNLSGSVLIGCPKRYSRALMSNIRPPKSPLRCLIQRSVFFLLVSDAVDYPPPFPFSRARIRRRGAPLFYVRCAFSSLERNRGLAPPIVGGRVARVVWRLSEFSQDTTFSSPIGMFLPSAFGLSRHSRAGRPSRIRSLFSRSTQPRPHFFSSLNRRLIRFLHEGRQRAYSKWFQRRSPKKLRDFSLVALPPHRRRMSRTVLVLPPTNSPVARTGSHPQTSSTVFLAFQTPESVRLAKPELPECL